MSNYDGHIKGAVSATIISGISGSFLVYYNYIELDSVLLGSISSFLFALFPDIDTKSKPSKYFYSALIIFLSYLFFIGNHYLANIVAIFSLIPQILKHRGLLHYKTTATILPTFIFYYYYTGVIDEYNSLFIYTSSVLGYYIHLYLDDLI